MGIPYPNTESSKLGPNDAGLDGKLTVGVRSTMATTLSAPHSHPPKNQLPSDAGANLRRKQAKGEVACTERRLPWKPDMRKTRRTSSLVLSIESRGRFGVGAVVASGVVVVVVVAAVELDVEGAEEPTRTRKTAHVPVTLSDTP